LLILIYLKRLLFISQAARAHSASLELQRDQLVAETERLLRRADADTGELRAALHQRDRQLTALNAALEKAKYVDI